MFESSKLTMFESLRPILPLPLWQKLAVLFAAFALIAGAYFYLGWMPVQELITQQTTTVELQKLRLLKNMRLARDLPRKKKEYANLEKQLKVALNMLPKKSQIPDLLENVFLGWQRLRAGI